MLGRRVFVAQMVGAAALPAPAVAVIGVEVKLDIVAAMQELASWVKAVFGSNDARRQRAAREALPGIVSILLEVASIKAAMQRDYEVLRPLHDPDLDVGSQERRGNQELGLFVDRMHDYSKRLETNLNELNARLRALEPEWRLRNVTTLSLLMDAVEAREAKMLNLSMWLTKIQMWRVEIESGRYRADRRFEERGEVEAFFLMQRVEAEQLRQLARDIAATASLPSPAPAAPTPR